MASRILTIALLLGGLLAGCSTAPSTPVAAAAPALQLDSRLFGERPALLTATDLHTLSAPQRAAFQRYLDDPAHRQKPAHRLVADYLKQIATDFSYLGETYTAREALEKSAGNCLSLAILTTALAEQAGVEVAYQLTDSLPVFESRGNVIERGVHVRSFLYDPGWKLETNALILSRPGIRIDYFPSETDRLISNVDRQEYLAMYYRNVAADAIAGRDLGNAYWLLMESVELAPEHPDSLNMLAIVYDRAGDQQTSERIYRYGIEASHRPVGLLRNYSIFLQRQGRVAEAVAVDARLAALEDPNPFDWIVAGQNAYDDGDYRTAITYFNKSIELAPYLHEGHFGLAKAHYRVGNLHLAERAFENAMSNANRPATRSLYAAKLAVLNEGQAVKGSL
jgi:Tfp pilus assembly protein PilF